MANIEHIIPHILKWETGTIKTPSETMVQYFERCRKRGYVNDPRDLGGATQSGLTLNTYKVYCRKHNISTPTVANLRAIPYATWLAVMKELFWDPCKADQIKSQSVADIFVDFAWGSGKGIKKVQQALGLVADGIVGPKTIAALNSKQPQVMFRLIYDTRAKYYNQIVANNPTQKVFLKGWMNRLNDLKFES